MRPLPRNQFFVGGEGLFGPIMQALILLLTPLPNLSD